MISIILVMLLLIYPTINEAVSLENTINCTDVNGWHQLECITPMEFAILVDNIGIQPESYNRHNRHNMNKKITQENFAILDINGDGLLSWEEFYRTHSQVYDYMNSLRRLNYLEHENKEITLLKEVKKWYLAFKQIIFVAG